MGRTAHAIRTMDLPTLFSFFGLPVEEGLLESAREQVASRFAEEVQEILRLCTRLRERERHQLFREALRLAYESALRGRVPAAGSPPRESSPRSRALTVRGERER
ncbi:MAG TPA: hypothetical protein PLL32_10305 [Anaeromyxobacteraceae bacterium]|nr:hypothetical protein [Anaeromyxobacteraceae bacterium]